MNGRGIEQDTIDTLDNLVEKTISPQQAVTLAEQAQPLFVNIVNEKTKGEIIRSFLHVLAIIVANNHTLEEAANNNWMQYFMTRLMKMGLTYKVADSIFDALYNLQVVNNDILSKIDMRETVNWKTAYADAQNLLKNSLFKTTTSTADNEFSFTIHPQPPSPR